MALQLHRCSAAKPQLFLDVQLFFEATVSDVGYWTGHEWLVKGCVVEPVHWSPVSRDAELRAEEF